ncbi:hypothetical protein QHI69_02690 [Burkholderia gladioli pv. gladioli]|uniref:hypothetical protein n=1 Tax=Burkholderia gladioli TaxID=28095 RepID=UPI0024BC21FE|nr:hypothetical protein [Burkholderia gladioli]MDJ1160809.1 hypothetical protein [Burkholderia gladioli pv. gladioli]
MAKLRCRPGDLARVVYSKNPALLGRIVLVDRINPRDSRWEVTLLGEPVLGVEDNTGIPLLTSYWRFKDWSLVPLRGDELESSERETEACHD